MMNIMRVKSMKVVLTVVLAVTLLLSACGGQANDSGNTLGSSGNSPQGSDNERVKLTILSTAQTQNPESGVEKEFAQAFMDIHPHVEIEFISVPTNDAYAKIITMATSKQLPDIFVNTAEFYTQAYEMGITADLRELFDESFVNGFHPLALEQTEIDGQMVFMPNFTIPMGLLYRADWFEEEGIAPPETWDEFMDAARRLTKDTNGDGIIDRWGFGMVGTKNSSGGSRYVPMMRTFGVKELYQDENGNWETEFDSPESIAFLKLFTDLVFEGLVPPGPLQTGYAEAVTMMANEQIAMMITGPHTIGAVLAQNPDLEGKLAGVPIPKQVEHASTLGLLGYSIYKDSPNKEIAAEYLKFTMEKENAIRWTQVTGRLPSRIEPLQDPAINNDMLSGFVKAMDYAYQIPNVPYYAKVYDYVGEAYQSVILGHETVEEAAARAANSIREEIDRNR